MLSENRAALQRFFATHGFSLQQKNRFDQYIELLEQWQKRVHLVSKADICRLVDKHFYESLLFIKKQFIQKSDAVMDVGSGAGFPGIPLKIAVPSLSMILVESKRRKALFLKEACQALGLESIRVYNQRVETLCRTDLPFVVDVAVARAVAPLERLWAWSEPLLAKDGCLLAIKGREALWEAEILKQRFPQIKYAQHPVEGDEKRLFAVER